MLLFAAALAAKPVAPTTALERLKAIPPEFWMRIGFAVVAVVALVFFLRKVAKMNKVVLTIVTLFIMTVVGFNWIYERNEPEWATPAVSFLAGFFPSKGPPPKKPGQAPGNKH